MLFELGDKVKVIDEETDGVVSAIRGDLIIVTSDGFDFSYKKHQLVKIDMDEQLLTAAYNAHIPNKAHIKTVDKPRAKALTNQERIEELGRVRGKRNSKGILEFDLHIHDLLVKHDHMTPGEMLNYQLDYAVHCLEATIKKRESALVFIHGVGKGVLRVELHRIIKSYGFAYHDGFMQEYGIGATRVELRGL